MSVKPIKSTMVNDQIDIYAEPDISVQFLTPDVDTELRIELKGKSIDNSVVNAIRRTIMMYIPIYGFNRSNIFIETKKTHCMYNFSMIYNQIESLPIFDIPNYFDLENPEIFLPTEVMRQMFSSFLPNKYEQSDLEISQTEPDANKQMFKIEFSINYKNNTEEDVFVGTHHAVLKVDGKVSSSYLNHRPVQLLVLKPTEELSMRAEANLGIAYIHTAYDATTSVIFEKVSDTEYRLWYETLGQLDKYLIFSKACIILTKRLEKLAEYLKNTYPDDLPIDQPVTLTLVGAEHTLGNLLATVLQKCIFTLRAGYCKAHPQIDETLVSYQLDPKSKHGPIKVILDCIAYLVRVFDTIAHRASVAKKK